MDGGNVNLVYLCQVKMGDGDMKSLVVKQPLPYVKCVNLCGFVPVLLVIQPQSDEVV